MSRKRQHKLRRVIAILITCMLFNVTVFSKLKLTGTTIKLNNRKIPTIKEIAEKSEPEKKKGPEIIIFDGHLPRSYYSGYGLHGNELTFKRNVMNKNLTQKEPFQTSVKKVGQKRSNSFVFAQATQSKRPFVELYSRKELKSNLPKVSAPLLIQPTCLVNSQSKTKNIQNKKTVSLLSHLEPDPLSMDSFLSCNLDSENRFNLQNELNNK